jgi:hypothetical protein
LLPNNDISYYEHYRLSSRKLTGTTVFNAAKGKNSRAMEAGATVVDRTPELSP